LQENYVIVYLWHWHRNFFTYFKLIITKLQIIFSYSITKYVITFSVSCFCLGSSWAPCRWFLLLGGLGVAFAGRHLFLLILFTIFYMTFVSGLSSFKRFLWDYCTYTYVWHKYDIFGKYSRGHWSYILNDISFKHISSRP
jgi:hypothetical protein